MDVQSNVFNFVIIFLILVVLTLYLRARGFLTTEAAPTVSRMVTECTLPAMIFRQLASTQVDGHAFQAAGCILLAEAMVAVVAFLLGRYALRLSRQSLGVYMVCATFGSTSLIGNFLIKIAFNDDLALTATGVLVGQLAVGLPIATVGQLVIGYCGARSDKAVGEQLRSVCLSPAVLAIVAGLAWSAFRLPVNAPLAPLFDALKVVEGAMPFLVAILTGLSLQRMPIVQKTFFVIASACILLLLVQPALVEVLLHWLDISDIDSPTLQMRQVTFLLATMPATPLAIAFSVRYGGDAALAGSLVIATTLLSAASIPLSVALSAII